MSSLSRPGTASAEWTRILFRTNSSGGGADGGQPSINVPSATSRSPAACSSMPFDEVGHVSSPVATGPPRAPRTSRGSSARSTSTRHWRRQPSSPTFLTRAPASCRSAASIAPADATRGNPARLCNGVPAVPSPPCLRNCRNARSNPSVRGDPDSSPATRGRRPPTTVSARARCQVRAFVVIQARSENIPWRAALRTGREQGPLNRNRQGPRSDRAAL